MFEAPAFVKVPAGESRRLTGRGCYGGEESGAD